MRVLRGDYFILITAKKFVKRNIFYPELNECHAI
jgi:hypothetical protein